MRFLDPKTDFAFKRIFGSDASHDVLISLLNAVLRLDEADRIVDVTILDPYQAPKIAGLKNTFLDVRATDQRGRLHIIEMQVLNFPGFEKKVLYNACKAYANQLIKGEDYRSLLEVIAVTITDFEMFIDLPEVINAFRMRAEADPDVKLRDIELVFVELPKFRKAEDEIDNTVDRWLHFFKVAGDLSAVPKVFEREPAIIKALELANRASLTRDELDQQENREMYIAAHKALYEVSTANALAKGKAEGLAEGEAKGKVEGEAKGRAEMLLRQFRRKFGEVPAVVVARLQAAGIGQLDAWSERFVDARSLEDVFEEDHPQ